MIYTFFKDEFGTIWWRDTLQIEADSYEEAQEKLIKAIEEDDTEDFFVESTPMFETWNAAFVQENKGFSTVELVDPETDKTFYKNGK